MDRNRKPIAMAYVPWQEWQNVYDPKRALSRGTIFAELDLPFTGQPNCEGMKTKGGCSCGRH